MLIAENEIQLELPLDPTLPKYDLNTPSDPEFDFLQTTALNVYSQLKRQYPDISIREIQEATEHFKGARVRKYIPIFLVHLILEQRIPRHPQSVQALQLSFADIAPFTKPTSRSPFLDRLKKPLQALGIKL